MGISQSENRASLLKLKKAYFILFVEKGSNALVGFDAFFEFEYGMTFARNEQYFMCNVMLF